MEAEIYTFNLPCGECIIRLEDITLELSLLVDGSIVMGSVVVGDWGDICEKLQDKVPDKFYGSRIEMKWLEDNFSYLHNTSSALQRE
ncbi:hypothetical protein PVK06_016744 [Gossypium arboreum]|uniref:Aminotransferase-like plant mobile domain-containing protein n=1 Tax=Gossypium arboreum TaxID=29729 RepID=A0ABR0Q1B0_GOSAR|nr:hypothetical protein PVK06_016744 [Gossypium arboreum]